MVIGHGDPPVSHRALWIGLGHFTKCMLGSGIGKRVQQSHGAFKAGLDAGRTRTRKRNGAQSFRRGMIVTFFLSAERQCQQYAG